MSKLQDSEKATIALSSKRTQPFIATNTPQMTLSSGTLTRLGYQTLRCESIAASITLVPMYYSACNCQIGGFYERSGSRHSLQASVGPALPTPPLPNGKPSTAPRLLPASQKEKAFVSVARTLCQINVPSGGFH